MGYADATKLALWEPMGADVTVSTGNLAAARLQAAINRVISGARTDSGIVPADEGGQILAIGLQAEARATPLINVDGVIGSNTNAALRTAAQIAGIITGESVPPQITLASQVTKATDQLNAAADRRSYPVTDTVKSSNPIANIPLPPGIPPTVGGVSTQVLVLGAVGVGALVFLMKRRKRTNPARRRRRRR